MTPTVIIALLLASATFCYSQSLPDAPSQKISPKQSLTTLEVGNLDENLYRFDSLLRVGDSVTTHMFLHDPCKCFVEVDPVAPNDGRWTSIMVFQTASSSAIWSSHNLLITHGHRRIARMVLLADIISESYAVGHNAYIIKRYGK